LKATPPRYLIYSFFGFVNEGLTSPSVACKVTDYTSSNCAYGSANSSTYGSFLPFAKNEAWTTFITVDCCSYSGAYCCPNAQSNENP